MELVNFRIEVPRRELRKLSRQEYTRLFTYLLSRRCAYDSSFEGSWWEHPAENYYLFKGRASSDSITLLQALARGHDVVGLLEKLELFSVVWHLYGR